MKTVPTSRDAERLSRFDVRPAGPKPRDIVLVIVLIAATILEAALRTDLSWRLATALVTIAALSTLPWRRIRPLLVVAATTVISAGFEITQVLNGIPSGGLVTMFALLAAPYALFRWGTARERIIGGIVLATGLVVSIALSGVTLLTGEGIAGAVAGAAFVGGAALIGALRRERVASRSREFAAIRAQEREALARDLHDTVAHHASAIVIRAQVARMAPDDIARVSESLEVIEREASSCDGRHALPGRRAARPGRLLALTRARRDRSAHHERAARRHGRPCAPRHPCRASWRPRCSASHRRR